MSLLLYGPSNCGKTFLANAIFGEINDPKGYIELKAQGLLKDPSKIDKAFKSFDRCELRCILIEDVDILFKDLRQHSAARFSLMSNIKNNATDAIVIGTSRYPHYFEPDEAESFHDVIPVIYPAYEDRLKLLISVGQWSAKQMTIIVAVAKDTEWWNTEEVLNLANILWAAKENIRNNVDTAKSKTGSNVNLDKRKMIALELLSFTAEFCTVTEIRDAIKSEYGTSTLSSLDDTVSLKPSLFGCTIDVKEFTKLLWKKLRKKR